METHQNVQAGPRGGTIWGTIRCGPQRLRVKETGIMDKGHSNDIRRILTGINANHVFSGQSVKQTRASEEGFGTHTLRNTQGFGPATGRQKHICEERDLHEQLQRNPRGTFAVWDAIPPVSMSSGEFHKSDLPRLSTMKSKHRFREEKAEQGEVK